MIDKSRRGSKTDNVDKNSTSKSKMDSQTSENDEVVRDLSSSCESSS